MEFDESVSTSQAQAAGLGSSGFSDNSDPSLGDDDYTVTGTPTEFRTLQNYNQARGASSTNPFPESFFSQLFGPDNVNYTNILGSNRINEINNLRYNQATGGMSNRTGANTGKPYQMGDYYIGQPTQMGTVSEVPQTGIMSVMNNLPVIGPISKALGRNRGLPEDLIESYMKEQNKSANEPSFGSGILNSITSSFTDAKNALGEMGDAVGGLTLPDLSGIFSTQTGQEAMNNMEGNVAFDASGNRIELGDLTQAGATIPVTDPILRTPTNPIFNTSQVSRQQLDSMNRGGTGFATAAGSLFPRTTENSPNFSTPGEENLGMTINRMSPNRYSLNAQDPGFQIEMNRLKPAERAFLTGRTDTISPMDSTYDDDFQKTAEANLNAGSILQGIGSKFRPQINQFLKQNINPNLNFESGFRRDTDDPDKMMPYMGVNMPVSFFG